MEHTGAHTGPRCHEVLCVNEIQADHNKELKIEGIVVNQFQPRANLPQRTVQELIDEGLPVLQPYLGASVKIKE